MAMWALVWYGAEDSECVNCPHYADVETVQDARTLADALIATGHTRVEYWELNDK